MKIQLTFKNPDAVFDAIRHLSEDQSDECEEVIKKFIKHGEYVTVELDTETQTVIVVPV